ncbi:MAG: HD domain-containing protein [Candidatus Thorarchaeota archaeon]
MTAKDIIRLAKHGETLKRVMRSGWALAGVNRARNESISEHSYGAALLSLLISRELLSEGYSVELGKVTSMALIHDLPESFTSDIPRTKHKLGGEILSEGKKIAEKEAIALIVNSSLSFKKWIEELWEEIGETSSVESRIVSCADTLDMLIHALALEESGVSPSILDQFFRSSQPRIAQMDISVANDIFWSLYEEHLENAKTMGIDFDMITRS